MKNTCQTQICEFICEKCDITGWAMPKQKISEALVVTFRYRILFKNLSISNYLLYKYSE